MAEKIKASELVDMLNDAILEHGDLYVFGDFDAGYWITIVECVDPKEESMYQYVSEDKIIVLG